MKKKYIILSAAFALSIGLSSCSDYLNTDKYFRDRMSLEDVFKNEDYSEEWLANAYSYLTGSNADVSSKGHTPFCFADDMYFGDRDDFYKRLKNGEYGEGDQQGPWGACYKGIRQASIFIQNIDINEDFTPAEISDYKAQARFVRAYYYWLLLRKYGPIPLMPEDGLDYTESYNSLACSRNTYDECADFIASEMAVAAKDLPLERGALSIARPTRGAALAARAKVLLYAASPINNPRPSDTERFTDMVDDKGSHLIAQEYDESKWARAAAAARDVIELNRYELYHTGIRESASVGFPKTITPPDDGDFSENEWPDGWKNIDPFESYRAIFNGQVSAENNPELIFTRGQNQSGEGVNVMVGHQLPRFTSGWNTHGLTQKQCDTYYMNNGRDCPGKDKEIGRGDGSDREAAFVTEEDVKVGKYPFLAAGVSLQYANREPRFYASVAYNGSVWYFMKADKEEFKGPRQIFYYRGGGNGYTNTMFWLRTGIGVMKFVHPDDANDNNSNDAGWTHIRKKAEPAIRYAEVLLIYAEALNELNGSYNIASWDGSKTYTVSRVIDEIKKGVRPIRCRAGVPDYTQNEYENQILLRAKLKRERQIELMGEGHRYYDLRRWKDAPVEEALPIYGCNTLMTENQAQLFHTPVVVPSLPTTFSRKMYFWPISHSELKRNKRLTQNPGWTYND